jgi:hypothetical protein
MGIKQIVKGIWGKVEWRSWFFLRETIHTIYEKSNQANSKS